MSKEYAVFYDETCRKTLSWQMFNVIQSSHPCDFHAIEFAEYC